MLAGLLSESVVAVKIVNFTDTRLNLVKMAAVIEARDAHADRFQRERLRIARRFDERLRKAYFEAPVKLCPEINLGIGTSTDTEQIAKIKGSFKRGLPRSALRPRPRQCQFNQCPCERSRNARRHRAGRCSTERTGSHRPAESRNARCWRQCKL